MARYRKKPIEIEAEQFDPKVEPWPVGVQVDSVDGDDKPKGYSIDTLEGRALNVQPGDWIITGIAGERYPCKPDIFEVTYEKVEE